MFVSYFSDANQPLRGKPRVVSKRKVCQFVSNATSSISLMFDIQFSALSLNFRPCSGRIPRILAAKGP